MREFFKRMVVDLQERGGGAEPTGGATSHPPHATHAGALAGVRSTGCFAADRGESQFVNTSVSGGCSGAIASGRGVKCRSASAKRGVGGLGRAHRVHGAHGGGLSGVAG